MAETDHAETRRRAILVAAADLFDARGYAATTMEEVAAGAGISKGSIYNYFRSKNDLFTQLYSEMTAVDEDQADALLGRPGSAMQKIEALMDYWFNRLDEHMRLGRLTLEFWATGAREQENGGLSSLLQGTYGRWLDRIAEVLAAGVANGELSGQLDPRPAANMFIGVLNGLLVHMILNVGVRVDEELLPAVKRSVLAGLGATAAGEAHAPGPGEEC